MSTGDLYSVKIMWPRSPEERSRHRHTGFVCFLHRSDAEDAMEACQDKDPFRVGRPLTMSWGKHVLKDLEINGGGIPIVKRGIGDTLMQDDALLRSTVPPQTVVDAKRSIHVVVPAHRERAQMITTVASFVAKDGAQFEQLLLQQEPNNPQWNFISPTLSISDQTLMQEHVFYKWRVYAFCQGDTVSTWNTEPFVMIQPDGCMWYPPPLDANAAQKEADERRVQEDNMRSLKEQRQYTKGSGAVGRSAGSARRMDRTRLTESEHEEMHRLFHKQLNLSRESICQAMAFCFEKSGAALQIADVLKELLLHIAPGTTVETISARVYLISDILFNTQQPGIRNAFLYRDAIEKMAPEVFRTMGTFARTHCGRMSQERIGMAIRGIFAAWTQWGVFDLSFINDLEAHYEGREIQKTEIPVAAPAPVEDTTVGEEKDAADPVEDVLPRGDWTCIPDDGEDALLPNRIDSGTPLELDLDGESLDDSERHLMNDDDLDGVPLDGNDLVEEPLNQTAVESNDYNPLIIGDGEPLEDDNLDGEPLDDENLDGEPLEDDASRLPLHDPLTYVNGGTLGDGDLDGEPLEDNLDGEPLDDNLDGEPLDAARSERNDLDGAPLNEDELDGERVDLL